jgi:phytoene dehydrogenase-like protein
MTRYDCVIIGAGHNGLVAAAYLGRSGKKVCVLERRHILGGCTSTEELHPGFRLNPAAYVISLFPPAIISELGLKEHGLAILPRNPSSFTPLLDGRSLLLGHDDAANLREIGKFSARDAENYPQYDAMLTQIAAALEPIMLSPAPRMPPRPIRDLGKWWLYRKAFKQLGSQWRTAFELFTAPATRILNRFFESEPLRATIATDAIIGAMAAPSTPGSAYVLLHHVMGETGGKRGVWAYIRGGVGGLADALEKVCLAAGVEIRRNAEVVRINVQGSEVAGVALADGTEIAAKTVASCIDGNQTFLKLLGAEHLPNEFAEQVRRLDYSSASAKINLALDGVPDFNTGTTPREIALRGTTHICPDLEYIERAFDDAKYGRPSQSPVLEMTMASMVDDTLAPPGKHVASIFVQYAPYKLAEGTWDDRRREAFADRCIDILAQYAPNVKNLILHRHVATPVDMERTYGLTGGNIMQGAMTLDQLGPMRLDYRTPVRGLFLCGAATHPGGGIMGICGRNAARAILRG